MQPMFLFLSHFAFSAVIGIDFGYSNVKVAVISRSRTLHVAVTEDGTKIIPNTFAFWNRTKSSTTTHLHNWTDSSADAFDWTWGSRAQARYLDRPATGVPGRLLTKSRHFTLAGYEITSLWLHSLLDSIITSENLTAPLEVVFAIPPSFKSQEKSFLYAAASLAGITTTQFIDYLHSPAEFYLLNPSAPFLNSTSNVAFVDIGAHGMRISIWAFDGRGPLPQATQLAGQFSEGVGGQSLDLALANHLARKHSINIADLRTAARFIADCQDAKEHLSFYPAVDLALDDDDAPRTITIARDELLSLAGAFNGTLVGLVRRALQQAGLRAVDAVEVIGHVATVPFVRRTLQAAFNVSEVGKTLHPDHAHAFGAALAAARASRQFRVREVRKVGLLSASAWLIAARAKYHIFRAGQADDFAQAVRLTVRPGERLVLAADSVQNAFMRFAVNVSAEADVDLVFVHNDYLMPIPYNASAGGAALEIEAEDVGWEVSAADLQRSQARLARLIALQKARRERERMANDFEGLVLELRQFCRASDELGAADREFIAAIVEAGLRWFEDERAAATVEEYGRKMEEVHRLTDRIVGAAKESDLRKKMLRGLKKGAAQLQQLIVKAMEIGVNANEAKAEMNEVDDWLRQNEETADSTVLGRRKSQLEKAISSLKGKVNPRNEEQPVLDTYNL